MFQTQAGRNRFSRACFGALAVAALAVSGCGSGNDEPPTVALISDPSAATVAAAQASIDGPSTVVVSGSVSPTAAQIAQAQADLDGSLKSTPSGLTAATQTEIAAAQALLDGDEKF